MLAASAQVLQAGKTSASQHVEIGLPAARRAIVLGLRDAAARLSHPDCRQVLDDFSDWPGRAIVAQLEGSGVGISEYALTRVWFVDGSDTAECRTGTPIAAFTGVGHKVVRVCASRLAHLDRCMRAVEMLVIHEILHTLGLPENPPSSAEITRQVRRRCA